MGDWKITTLGDVASFQRGHDLPETFRIRGCIPVMGSFGITGWHNKSRVNGPGVTVGRSGGSIGVVSFIDRDYWPLNTCLFVTNFHGNNPKFVYYLLKTIDLAAHNSGSAQPSLNRNFIHPLPVSIPDRQEQDSIATLLGAIDDKIEINHLMNEALETMARLFFKDWFVDFGPTRAKAEGRPPYLAQELWSLFPDALDDDDKPMGWRISKIGHELTTLLGGTPSRVEPTYWGGDIPWINSGKANDFRVSKPSECITHKGFHASATKILPLRTTIIAITGATLGQVSLTEIETCANQSIVGVVGTEQLPSEFIYFWIKENIQHLLSSQTGGAQQHVNKNNVNDLPVLCPNGSVMLAYFEIAHPIFDCIAANCFESQSLAKTRDLLLPKLMSGEISLSEAEKIVEQVA